jgi:CO/xanthine dehydrogenase Mo-binding subunit
VTPALHAAILDAVGVDLDVFPFTAERVATALAGLERADGLPSARGI